MITQTAEPQLTTASDQGLGTASLVLGVLASSRFRVYSPRCWRSF
jgi:hypothetical protein